MNPFELKPMNINDTIIDWNTMYEKPYNKYEVDPYTKARIILANGAEVEATFFSHQFSRNCHNNDIRRQLALVRRIEQQQQKRIQCLKPLDETILETTISYEQLAVDLTANFAQNEINVNVKNALDFALLEDFDHLYRYANLLEYETGICPEKLVGCYTEIMPGRPTISEHRYPYDTVNNYIDFKDVSQITKLHASIITAAEQQTMNFYMNVCGFYTTDIGRQLYQEIGMIEEEHVTQYGSLLDPTYTWLENLLNHEYSECYLYYSSFIEETNPRIKCIWEQCFQQEVSHLHIACDLLKKYENKEWQQIIPDGTFPNLISLHQNIDYVREALKNTVNYTSIHEDYMQVCQIPSNSNFFFYQQKVNCNVSCVPSHIVIDKYIDKSCKDYRYETALNPILELQNRESDNTCVGRQPLCNI
ncbi:MAG: hypothetical protein RSB76_01880 [Clostridia bacterium]